MTRVLALAAALIVAALLGAADGSAVRSQTPKLFGTVGPGFAIRLQDAQGSQVTKLDPGTFVVEVEDLSDEHNFHLFGPAVDRFTPVEGTGKDTWSVTFQDGTYMYVCDPHATTLRGTFTAGNPPPTSPPPSSPPVTAKSKLLLTSGPGFVISLRTSAGKQVKKMKLGTYTVIVRDRGSNHNAHLVAPGFNRKTTPLTYTGTKRWKVKLGKAGTLRFLCDPHAREGMRGSAKIVR
jgi:plastocyanin